MDQVLSLLLLAARPSAVAVPMGAWTAGANTTLSQVGDRARCALPSGTNPRIYKQVNGLTIGASYKLIGNVYMGTLSVPNVFVRVHTAATLGSAGPVDHPFTVDSLFDENFLATATTHYVGIVPVTSIVGEYAEVTFDLKLYRN